MPELRPVKSCASGHDRLTVRPGSETRSVYHPVLPGPSRAGRFVAVYSALRKRLLRGSFEPPDSGAARAVAGRCWGSRLRACPSPLSWSRASPWRPGPIRPPARPPSPARSRYEGVTVATMQHQSAGW